MSASGTRVTWLCIIALAVWIFLQDRRVKALEDKVRALSPEALPKPSPSPAVSPVEAAPAKPTPIEPSAEAGRPQTTASPVANPAPIAPAFTWAQASTWLAENGLAWLGGGGLALGGLLLVVYAAQRGVFTPSLRIVAAAVLGLAMIAASEWIRRQTRAPGGRHALAAATAAGAGAVTLYGAVWAAHALYGLIPLPLAAALVVAVSGGLLGLALLHGEALALLALFGAFLAPAITHTMSWSPPVLDAYLVLLGATGAAVSGLRRWGRAGVIALAGLTLWSLGVLIADRRIDAAILLAVAQASPIAAVLWRRHRKAAESQTGDLFARLPLIALVIVSLASLALWAGPSAPLDQHATAPILAALLLVVGAALARRQLVEPRGFGAPVAATVLGVLLSLPLWRAFTHANPAPAATSAPFVFGQVLGLAALIAGAGLAAGLRATAPRRTPLLAIGAVGATVLVNLAWPYLDRLPGASSGMSTGLTGLLLTAGAVLLARRVEDPRRDPGLGLWVAAAAELAFLTVHTLTPDHLEPAALAVVALALAFAADRLTWRGLAATAVAGSIAVLAALLRPSVMTAATNGQLGLPLLAGVIAVAVVALAAATRLLGRKPASHRTEAEALSTGALLVLLTGLFLILHTVLAQLGHPAGGGQALLENSLRTALVLSAGLLLAMRGRPDDGPIARWRLIIVISLGAAYGLVVDGLILHPWWGGGSQGAGLPLLNDLLLSYLAPAGLLAAAARARPDPLDRWTRGWIAAAAIFGLLWAVTATRHAFHGAAMHLAPIGRAEACAYVVIGLLTARAFRMDRLRSSRAAWLHAVAPVTGWMAIAAALLAFGWLASPWWGPFDAPMVSTAHVVLLLALYAAGAGAALSLRRGNDPFSRTALCVAVAVLFAFVTLLTRFAFHGVDMRQGLDRGGLETWTFSAVWTVFGLIVLFRASARKDAALRWLGLVVLLTTAGKVLLFDMATLDGVVRAASFLAVGALFIAGALVARRLNAGHKSSPDDQDDRNPAP